jgi:hypothetical protein
MGMEVVILYTDGIDGLSFTMELRRFGTDVLLKQYGKIDVQTSVMIIVVPLVAEV